MATNNNNDGGAMARRKAVKRAQPILERITRASNALACGAVEGRVLPSSKWSRSEREKFDREKLEGLRVVARAGMDLLGLLAVDLAALAAIVGAPGAPADWQRQTPETAEALEWLRRQLDGLGKEGA
jgi:hypothetical protein